MQIAKCKLLSHYSLVVTHISRDVHLATAHRRLSTVAGVMPVQCGLGELSLILSPLLGMVMMK